MSVNTACWSERAFHCTKRQFTLFIYCDRGGYAGDSLSEGWVDDLRVVEDGVVGLSALHTDTRPVGSSRLLAVCHWGIQVLDTKHKFPSNVQTATGIIMSKGIWTVAYQHKHAFWSSTYSPPFMDSIKFKMFFLTLQFLSSVQKTQSRERKVYWKFAPLDLASCVKKKG